MDPTLPLVGLILAATVAVLVYRRLRPGAAVVGPELRGMVARTGLRVSATGPDLSELTGVVAGRPAVVRLQGRGGWVEARMLQPVADTALAALDPEIQAAAKGLEASGCGELTLSPMAVRVALPRASVAPLILPWVLALAEALERVSVAPWRDWAQSHGLSFQRRALPPVDPATTVDRVLARDPSDGPQQRQRQPDQVQTLLGGPEWCLRITGQTDGGEVDLRLDARPEGPRLVMRALLARPFGGETEVWARDAQSRELPGPGHPFADLALVARGTTDPALAAALARPEVLEPLLELLHGWPDARLRSTGLTLEAEGERARVPAARLALDVLQRLAVARGAPAP